jgi:hypothetical protein
MEPGVQTILFFGDQTDSWVSSIDQLFKQSSSAPWLQFFLDELAIAFKAQTKGMDHILKESLGDFSSLQELAEKYRYGSDEMGLVQAILIYTVRAGMLLQYVLAYLKTKYSLTI